MTDARLQPLLHDALLTFRSPLQAWSRPDGSMAPGGIDGVYHSDVRVVTAMEIVVAGSRGEHIATALLGAGEAISTLLLRELESEGADPDVRLEIRRTTDALRTTVAVSVESRRAEELRLPLAVRLTASGDPMDAVKAGAPSSPAAVSASGSSASWSAAGVSARIEAPDAHVLADGAAIVLAWGLTVPARSTAAVSFTIE